MSIPQDNALLYQGFDPASLLASFGIDATEDRLFQSQLTTITKKSTEQVYRKDRSSFDAFVFVGETTSVSSYRERKVTESKFYTKLKKRLLNTVSYIVICVSGTLINKM